MTRILVEPARPSAPSSGCIDEAIASIEACTVPLSAWASQYLENHRVRLAHDLDLLESHLEARSRVLDVGCSPPVLLVALKNRGCRVCGVDLDPSRFQSAIDASGLDVHAVDIESSPLPFGQKQFDVVVFNEIFEHLRIDLIHTLSELFRVTRPGGRLFLSTPNLRSLYGYANLFLRDRSASCSPDLYEQYAKLDTVGHMGHVREYTRGEVKEFLTRIGFEVETVVLRGMNGPRWTRPLFHLLPRLRPFFSVIATRRS